MNFSPLDYNRNFNKNFNTQIGPQVRQGFRNTEFIDDSDNCTNVEEICISPVHERVQENNRSFGGNYHEDICNSCIDGSIQGTKVTEPVKAFY